MTKKDVSHKTIDYEVIVVGGGSSGLFAAGSARVNNARVLVLEKNHTLGKKLAITGGGRCNITNDIRQAKVFLENFPQAKKYLYSAFDQFAVDETFDFFENKLKLPLVTQARTRVFPASERAPDVRDALVLWCKEQGVVLKTKSPVKNIEKQGQVWHVSTATKTYTSRAVVLSTGGRAAPETGSTGDGFKWLQTLGHHVSEPTPTLVPLKTDTSWVHRLQGVSWDYLKLRFYTIQNGTPVQKINKTGKVLFTHFGISGPMVLNTSYDVTQLLNWGEVECSLDLFPDTEFHLLDKRVANVMQSHAKKTVGNALVDVIAQKALLLELLGLCGIDPAVISGSVGKEQRKQFVHYLKDLRFPIVGTMGFDRAVLADGGVSLDEVDFKTMESKKQHGLYITGDLLNINRPSGGFSLQLCWTTGSIAGRNASKSTT